jgi:uncharacterized membrane protein YbhN (UPF0104 family)
VFLAFLLRRIAADELWQVFLRAWANWPVLLLALALPMLGKLLAAARWQTLMKKQGVHLPIVSYAKAMLVGAWFNQVLPSTIGGDLARGFWITKRGESALVNVTVVTLDRGIGSVVLCSLALVCALLSTPVSGLMPSVWTIPALLVAAAIAASIVGLRYGGALGKRLFSLPFLGGYRERAVAVYGALRAYRWPPLAWAALLSLGIQLLIIVEYLLFARALELGVSGRELALTVPVVTLISMIPVTINGLGLREGSFALLGAPIGLRATDSVALGWLFVAGALIWGLLGGIVYVRGRRS